MIVDAHVRIGRNREVALETDELLDRMEANGIDRALAAPCERCIAYDNQEGNEVTAAAARRSSGRILPYAVANPWRQAAAVDELKRARDHGARALEVDSSLQGFDLLDGLVEPLLVVAEDAGWPVYVRTGTPPTALPLPLALLARRHPELDFIMGRSGATDFWIDAAPALRDAPNLYGDTSYAPWDTVLTEFAADSRIGVGRLVFATDQPYATAAGEVKRVTDWPITDAQRADVFGGTLTRLLSASR